jgi:hypothetical protein
MPLNERTKEEHTKKKKSEGRTKQRRKTERRENDIPGGDQFENVRFRITRNREFPGKVGSHVIQHHTDGLIGTFGDTSLRRRRKKKKKRKREKRKRKHRNGKKERQREGGQRVSDLKSSLYI